MTQHLPNTESMVNDALMNLNSVKGVTLQRMYSFIKEKYKIESLSARRKNLIKNFLRSLHELKELKNVTGRGLRGHMRLVNKQKFKQLVEKTNREIFSRPEHETLSSRDSVAYDLRNRSIIVHVSRTSQRYIRDISHTHTVREITTLPAAGLSESTDSTSNLPSCSTHFNIAYKRKNNYTPPSASPIRNLESFEIHTSPETPTYRTRMPSEQQRKRNQIRYSVVSEQPIDGETPRSSKTAKRRRAGKNLP